jgi:hypothetical protein
MEAINLGSKDNHRKRAKVIYSFKKQSGGGLN